MPYFDTLFFVSSLAFGWGLSLATYRMFALRYEWPMGELHANKPMVPVLLGIFAIVIALLFAAARGGEQGGWWIVLAGLIWGVLWTALMRVGSQISLIFAPAATVLLCLIWIQVRPAPDLNSEIGYFPSTATSEAPILERRRGLLD
jgi:hypothetical protein